MEKYSDERSKMKLSLETIMNEYASKQTQMIKTLSDKLKLSEKFVRTSTY
jgi:hypothetical protein